MREAKLFTSWVNPSPPHEGAMARFVEFVLAPENTAFRNEFLPFQRRIAQYGLYNSLAQVTLKIGAPGVPDFYQGTELWDFSLVDPDNRRPVDYEHRRALLQELDMALERDGAAAVATRLGGRPCDDRAKLFVTSVLLRFRRDHLAVFERVELGIGAPLCPRLRRVRHGHRLVEQPTEIHCSQQQQDHQWKYDGGLDQGAAALVAPAVIRQVTPS